MNKIMEDLHEGQIVEYKKYDPFSDRWISGKGKIVGFGNFGDTHVIWISDSSNGEVLSAAYQEVTPA